MDILTTLEKKSVLILGFGREGRDSLRFLRSKFPQKKIGIADIEKKEVKDQNVDLYFGDQYLEAVKEYEVIIKSPGVPFVKIKDFCKGKIITSQTDIFLRLNRERTVGVTGTKGKTTTCSTIYKILKEKTSKKIYLIGNIGKPVLQFVENKGLFIYELSSFQLQTASVSPKIAVFLNIFKDHLDQHENFEEYVDSKMNIARYQKRGDILIYNEKDKNLEKLKDFKGQKITFNPDLRLPGSAVYMEPILKVVDIFNVPKEEIEKVIKDLKPITHRLEAVGKFKGIQFFNDSAATIPEATAQAISLTEDLRALITGGVDKGGDYGLVADKIAENGLELVVLFPDTGKKIKKKLEERGVDVKIVDCRGMEEAVKKVYKTISCGACLLSPASSSFNMFSNYKDRGEQFKKYVKKYGQK